MRPDLSVVSETIARHRRTLTERCLSLEELAHDLGLDTAPLAALREEFQRFAVRVAVSGEVNRGKSTFLNGLLGARVFPRRSTVCTAVSTVLHDGHPRVRIHWRKGRPEERDLGPEPHKDLEGVVSKKNPRAADIVRVEVWYPNPFTREGVELIDTPGVNDPEHWREQITIRTLTQADTAILLLDAAKPLTRTERNFLTEHVLGEWGRRVVFVANKADSLSDAERVQVRARLERELSAYVERPDLHLVSSTEAVKASESGSAEQMARSGMLALRAHLQDILVRRSVEVFASARMARLHREAVGLREHTRRLLTESDRSVEEVLAEIRVAESAIHARQRSFDERMREQEAGLRATEREARAIGRRASEAASGVLSSASAIDRCLAAYAKSPEEGREVLHGVLAEAKREALSLANRELTPLFQTRWQRADADLSALVRRVDSLPELRIDLSGAPQDQGGGEVVLVGLIVGALVAAATGGLGWAILGAIGGGVAADAAIASWRATARESIEKQLRSASKKMCTFIEKQIVGSAEESARQLLRTTREQAGQAFAREALEARMRREAATQRRGDIEAARARRSAWHTRAQALEEACR